MFLTKSGKKIKLDHNGNWYSPPPRSFALPIRLGDPPWDLREEGERMQTVRSPSKTKELALTRELRVSDLPH